MFPSTRTFCNEELVTHEIGWNNFHKSWPHSMSVAVANLQKPFLNLVSQGKFEVALVGYGARVNFENELNLSLITPTDPHFIYIYLTSLLHVSGSRHPQGARSAPSSKTY